MSSILRLLVLVLAGLLVLVAGPSAEAQIEPLPELPMTLTGQTGLGLSGSSGQSVNGQGTGTTTGLYWTTSATLDGYYHDPRFLKFNVSPIYTYDSTGQPENTFHDDSEGINASVNFLRSSKVPLNFYYSLQWSGSTALTGGPTPISSSSSGFAHNWGVNWSYRRGYKWPTFTISYGSGGGDSVLAGGAGNVNYQHHNLQMMSNYQLLGIRFFANYLRYHSDEMSPNLLTGGGPSANISDQNGYNLGAQRSLPWIKGAGNFNFTSMNTTVNDVFGSSTTSFDNASLNVNSAPTRRLVLTSTATYTSSGLGQAISGIILGDNGSVTPASITQFTPLGSSRAVQGGGTYALGHGLSLFGLVAVEKDVITGEEDVTAYTGSGGLGYAHRVFGGSMYVAYNLAKSITDETIFTTDVNGNPVTQPGGGSVLTQSGSATYFRGIGRWKLQSALRFTDTSQSVTGVPLPGVTESYGGNLALSTRLMHTWNFSLSGIYNRTVFSPAEANATSAEGLSAAVARRNFSVTASLQRSSGYATTTAEGITPITQTNLIPALYSFPSVFGNANNSASLSATWSRRRLAVTGNYSYTTVNLQQTGVAPSNLGNGSWQAQANYRYRKLTFRAEFRHWTQNVSVNQNLNVSTNSYTFVVLRPFRLF